MATLTVSSTESGVTNSAVLNYDVVSDLPDKYQISLSSIDLIAQGRVFGLGLILTLVDSENVSQQIFDITRGSLDSSCSVPLLEEDTLSITLEDADLTIDKEHEEQTLNITLLLNNQTNPDSDTGIDPVPAEEDDITIGQKASYNVAFNTNVSAYGTTPMQKKWHGEPLVISGNKARPVEETIMFSSWNTSQSGNGTTYLPGDVYTRDAGLVLYGKWKTAYSTIVGDYVYTALDEAERRANVRVSDSSKSKSEYGAPAQTITFPNVADEREYFVTSMRKCYYQCSSMVTPPDLSEMIYATDMTSCFSGCTSLPTPPDMSNLTAVTDMASCFSGCSSLARFPDLSNMSQLSNFSHCYSGCTNATGEVALPDMSNVTTMHSAFYNCTSLTTPPDFSTATSVIGAQSLFEGCSSLVEGPDLSAMMATLTDNDSNCFTRAFYNCTSMVAPPVFRGVAPNIKLLTNCFYNCSSMVEPPDLSGMVNVTTMSMAFEYCSSLTRIPDMSEMTSLSVMNFCFGYCHALTEADLSGMSSVTNPAACFYGCKSLVSADMSGMTSATTLSSCFYGCTSLTAVDLSGLSSVTSLSACFRGCTALTELPDISDLTAVTNVSTAFYNCPSLLGIIEMPLRYGNISSSTDMFAIPNNTVSDHVFLLVHPDDVSDWENGVSSQDSHVLVASNAASSTSDMTTLDGVYKYMLALDSSGDLESLSCIAVDDTLTTYPAIDSLTTNLYNCFNGCHDMTAPPDMSNLSSVTSIRQCFTACYALATAPNLSAMTGLVDMRSAFFNCTSLQVPPDLSANTLVEDMYACFAGCTSMYYPPDISGMENLENVESCFEFCTALKGFLEITQSYDDLTSKDHMFDDMDYTGATTDPLVLIVPAEDRQDWIDYSKPSRVQVIQASASDTTVTMAPYDYTYSTDVDGQLIALACKVNSSYKSQTSYPLIDRAVTNMNSCFNGCTSLTTPPDMSNMTAVTNMAQCFYNCSSLTAPPNLSNLTAVTSMSSCFYGCASLATPPDLSNLTAVTSMYFCFSGCTSLTTPPDMSNMTAVTNMSQCFSGCTSLVEPPDMSNLTAVTNMSCCFQGCSRLATPPDLSNMTAVTDMSQCFYNCSSFTTPPDLSNLTAVTNMNWCFSGCTGLVTPPDMSNLTAVTSMGNCFSGCTKLRGFLRIGTSTAPSSLGTNAFGSSSQVNEEDLYLIVPSSQRANWTSYSKPSRVQVIPASASDTTVTMTPYDYTYRTNSSGQLTSLACKVNSSYRSQTSYPPIDSAVTSMIGCFDSCVYLATPPDLSNMTAVTDMRNCFWNCSSLTTPPDMSDMTAVTNMYLCFSGCTGLTTPPDMSNMTAVTNMSACFYNCTSLTTPPDMSNMTAVTNMSQCFRECSSLTAPPDLSGMTAVTNMSQCFYNCSSLTAPPDLTHCTAITTMTSCFSGCTNLTTPPDLTNCTAITTMTMCFYNCTSLTSTPDLTSCTAISMMDSCFLGCTSLTTPPDLTHCAAITNMTSCFYGCTRLTSSPDLTHCASLIYMAQCFYNCTSLTSPPDLTHCTAITNMANCFDGCTSLATPPDLTHCTAINGVDYCFYGCTSLLEGPDFSNCTSITSMYCSFWGCSAMLYPPKLPSYVSVMESTFRGCSSLLMPPDLSHMEYLYNVYYAFYGCTALRGFLTITSTRTHIASSSSGGISTGESVSVDMFGPSDQVNEEDLYLIVPASKRSQWESYPKPAKVHVIGASQTNQSVSYDFGYAAAVYRYTYSTDADGQLTELRCKALSAPCKIVGDNVVNETIWESFPPIDPNTTSMAECFKGTGDSTWNVLGYNTFTTQIDGSQEMRYRFPDIPDRVTDLSDCFYGCCLERIPNISETVPLISMSRCFYNCYALDDAVDLSPYSATLLDIGGCFYGCGSLSTTPIMPTRYTPSDSADPTYTVAPALSTLDAAFVGCSSLTIPPDISAVENATSLYATFFGCSGFTEWPALEDMPYPSRITDLEYCLGWIPLQTPPDLSAFVNVKWIGHCFEGCSALTTFPDLSHMTKLSTMDACFANCSRISGDLSISSDELHYSYYDAEDPPLVWPIPTYDPGNTTTARSRFNEHVFHGTVNDIWIVPSEDVTDTGSARDPLTSGDACWHNLYKNPSGTVKCPSNVHFYSPNMNPDPQSAINVRRIEGLGGYFIEAATGSWMMVKVTKPFLQMEYVKSMPTVRKIVVWAGSAEDRDYMETQLSINEDELADDPLSGGGGEALSRGMSYSRILYRPNPDVPSEKPEEQRMADLSLYTNGVYDDLGMVVADLDYGYFYSFIQRDTTTQVIAVLVEDSYGNVSKYVTTVTKSFATFSFLKPGTGVGVGIPARRNGFDVDMQSYFEENPMVYDIPTIPVVMTYTDSIPDDAHLPDPCLVVRMDPKYVWNRIFSTVYSESVLPQDAGFNVYLRGSFLNYSPQRAGRTFATSEPLYIGASHTHPTVWPETLNAGWYDSWSRGASGLVVVDRKIDSYFMADGQGVKATAYSFSPTFYNLLAFAAHHKPLLVSVAGCETVRFDLRGGNVKSPSARTSDDQYYYAGYKLSVEDEEGNVLGTSGNADSIFDVTGLMGKTATFQVIVEDDSTKSLYDTDITLQEFGGVSITVDPDTPISSMLPEPEPEPEPEPDPNQEPEGGE